MAPKLPLCIHVDFTGAYEMLDVLQAASDHVCKEVGLDEDSTHWVSVAIREAVANAIMHGNRNDRRKKVFVSFKGTFDPAPVLEIRVRDQGEGFDPDNVADPLAPENLLKGSGRGIFLIRSFMDDVILERAPQGGMEMCMIKRAHPAEKS